MKYMLLMYGAEDNWTEAEREDCIARSVEVIGDLHAKGKVLAASPLHPVSTATCLRMRDGKRQITDGPFAETTEQLGGYFIIEADNLDEAIAIASTLPPAERSTVEIRPLRPMPPPTFRRVLQINAPAATVYRALTTQTGIEGWWTRTCTIASEIGESSTVRFDKCFKTFRIDQLTPNESVRWHCTAAHIETDTQFANPAEWVGTSIHFRLETVGPATTQLTLEHIGLGPQFECYDLCRQGWDHFLASLKHYSETGVGAAFAPMK
jgi:hypothetical protein